jgi:adenylylsulfate kinase
LKVTRTRSFLKSVSWRIFGTLITTLLVFLFTGELPVAVSVGFFEVTFKVALYYLHERMWNMINFGRVQS